MGLRPITSGKIVLGGVDVTFLKPAARNIGFVPQDLALFPTMTVFNNISFSLKIRNWTDEEIKRRVSEISEWLGISHLMDRFPNKGLSGGEKQRVALGRALAFNPGILCLDEPLSALDDETRHEMYEVFQRIRQSSPVTVLHITHNLSETENLADDVFILKSGVIAKK